MREAQCGRRGSNEQKRDQMQRCSNVWHLAHARSMVKQGCGIGCGKMNVREATYVARNNAIFKENKGRECDCGDEVSCESV